LEALDLGVHLLGLCTQARNHANGVSVRFAACCQVFLQPLDRGWCGP